MTKHQGLRGLKFVASETAFLEHESCILGILLLIQTAGMMRYYTDPLPSNVAGNECLHSHTYMHRTAPLPCTLLRFAHT